MEEKQKTVEQESFDQKMTIAEQEFKLRQADNTAKQLENRKSKTNSWQIERPVL